MEKIAVIGSGLIGRAWATVFSRAGHQVKLYDAVDGTVERAIGLIEEGLVELKAAGLVSGNPKEIVKNISAASSLEDAVSNADYVQENTSEKLDVKREVFKQMDAVAPASCILASSTSTIQTSLFSEGLSGKNRCIVAHPVNPPHVVPIVEVSPASWTDESVVKRTYDLHARVGQVPIIVKKEVAGFILNRLQAALLREAWRLVGEDYVSAEDLDKTVRDGLGLRWAFMGPFETIDLNAPEGVADYAGRFGKAFSEMMSGVNYSEWNASLISKVESQCREYLSHEKHVEREAIRDKKLMALVAHKKG
jgi:L-gulonate 3-dehydrogenase